MKKFVALLLAVLLVFTMAACGKTQEKGKLDIYLIIKAQGNAYWQVVEAGAKKAAEEMGCNLTILGVPDEKQIEQQTALLQNAVSANADGIVIAVIDSVAQANEVSSAFKSGIPMVLIDTMAATEDYSIAYRTDNTAAGEAAAKELIAKLTAVNAPAGQIISQLGTMTSQTQVDRINGFKAYWSANAPDKWELVDDIRENGGSAEVAVTVAKDLFVAYPKAVGCFAPNNGSTVGFAAAIKEDNRTDLTFVGFDFSDDIVALINDSNFNVSTMLQNQFFMAYYGVIAACKLANGETVANLQGGAKVNDTGLTVVDKNNVDSDEVKQANGK